MVNVLLVVLLLVLPFTSARVRSLIIIYGSGLDHPEGTCTAFPELALVSERVNLGLVIVVLFIISVFGQSDVWPLRGDLVFFVSYVYFWLDLYFIDVLLNG